MKKFATFIVCVIVLMSLLLSACGMGLSSISRCHHCGDSVGDDPVKAGGRTYCSYNCYMSEALFN